MKTLRTLVILILLTSLAGAELDDSFAESLSKVENEKLELKRGTSLTQTAHFDGFNVEYQEGNLQPNWAKLSTDKTNLTEGPLRISAAPRMMLNQDGRAGYGADISVCINGAIDVSHSAQFGGLTQQSTSASLAPGKLLSLKVSRSVSGQDEPVTRFGPVLNLGRTNLSYEHDLYGARHQVLMTSNLSF